MGGEWNLYCEADRDLLAGYGDELAGIGTPTDGSRDAEGNIIPKVQYFQRDKSQDFDPTYQEPTSKDIWRGPYRFPCTVEFEEAQGHYDQKVDAEGTERTYTAEMVITVTHWTANVVEAHDPAFRAPQEGDVVTFFDGDRAFNVEKVEQSGVILTSNNHVDWKLQLRGREGFEPDRLLPPRLRPHEED